jgi:hypothetical protein
LCIDLNIQRNGTNSAAVADKRGLVRVLDQTTTTFIISFKFHFWLPYNKKKAAERMREGERKRWPRGEELPEPSIIGGNRVAAIVSLNITRGPTD